MAGNYRASWHNYTRKGFYHITLMKDAGAGDFGQLAGDWRLDDGCKGAPYVRASAIGRAIKTTLFSLKGIHPALLNIQYALMPDHLHILLGVAQDLDEHVGKKISAFKIKVNALAGVKVFASGYHDHILMDACIRETVRKYIRDNARRAVLRRAFPDFFSRTRVVEIDGVVYQAYGNIYLLDNPYKAQVVVHRADSPAKKDEDKARWAHASANGGVLVSPFIHRDEQAARLAGEDLGARIIKIHNRPIGQREKPAGHDFDLCAQGRLLLITPRQELPIIRSTCLLMNEIAAAIVAGRFSVR